MYEIERFCVSSTATVREVMEVIEGNKEGIALVVDEDGKLIGTITDGDIRRFLLAQRSMAETATKMMHPSPLTAPTNASEEMVRELLQKYRIRNVPLVDEDGRPNRLVTFRDLLYGDTAGSIAVIMAGGEGKRLRPITDNLPKPMVKVGEKPILENIVSSLAKAGIQKQYIAVNYMAEVIEEYFQDGSAFGVEISYLREERKLGTGGALTLLPEMPTEPLLVVNGDIIIKTDLSRLLDFHRQHHCAMCVGATQYRVNIPYGVLSLAEHYILGIDEKPKQDFFCNAGIYVLNPEVLRFIPKDSPFDMTELLAAVVGNGLPVAAFPIHEQWIDIGEAEDLERARETFCDSKELVEEGEGD
jgi:dTDP-glucose pyrophosphorylase